MYIKEVLWLLYSWFDIFVSVSVSQNLLNSNCLAKNQLIAINVSWNQVYSLFGFVETVIDEPSTQKRGNS